MKTKIVIITSVVSSLGFAGTIYYLNTTAPTARITPVADPEPVASAVAGPTRADKEVAVFFTNTVKVDWSRVESEDYRRYIANLRAIGCPEETIRDIIVADVNKLFQQREFAFGPTAPEKFEFWKRQHRSGISEEKMKQRIQLAREKRALLKELLGVDVPDSTPLAQIPSSRSGKLSFLPTDKQQQVSEIEATYQAKSSSLMGDKVRPNKADMEAWRSLQGEKRAELAKVLSPGELEELDLRTSNTAQFMRRTLGDFEMTEKEFRELFRLRQEFEQQYGQSYGPDDPRTMGARLELENRMRAAMGEERYSAYNREQNWTVSTLQNVANEFGVPKETAVKVFDLKPIAQEQSVRIRADQALSEEQRALALKAVEEQTVKAISEVIGPDAAQAYYRQGSWIKGLSQPGAAAPGNMH